MEVKSFDTPEEVLDYLEQLHKDAYKSFNECTDKQKTLTTGDYFIAIANDFVILNHILELEGEDKQEFQFAESMGYVMVKAWSNACPNGEMGSVHRSRAIAKIVDSKKHTASIVSGFLISVWVGGGQIDNEDLRWIDESDCLEVLV